MHGRWILIRLSFFFFGRHRLWLAAAATGSFPFSFPLSFKFRNVCNNIPTGLGKGEGGMGADGFGFFGLLSPPQKREGEGVAVGRNGHWVREGGREGGEGGGPPPDIAKGEEREAGCVEGGEEGRGRRHLKYSMPDCLSHLIRQCQPASPYSGRGGEVTSCGRREGGEAGASPKPRHPRPTNPPKPRGERGRTTNARQKTL